MSDLSLPTVLHSLLGKTQRHHPTTVTARTWGQETVRRTKHRTEKTKRLKTKAPKTKTLLEPNFWVKNVTQKDKFLGGVRRYPGRIFFFYYCFTRHRRRSPEVSDVTSRSPVPCSEINLRISIFYRSKKEKRQTWNFLDKFFWPILVEIDLTQWQLLSARNCS